MEKFWPNFQLATLFLFCCLLRLSSDIIGTHLNTDKLSLLALKSRMITSNASSFTALVSSWTANTSVCNWVGVTCNPHTQRVVELDISNRSIQGSIPPEMGNLSFLRSLDMSSNLFHGDLPKEMARLRRLRYIDLYNNSLGGELPKHLFENMTKLETLDLEDNNFDGPIPSTIGDLSKLEILALNTNNLTGQIPTSICNLSDLSVLDLSRNRMEGSIPQCLLTNLSASLWFLALKGNRLNGPIPKRFQKGNILAYLNLNGNQLEAPLPKSLLNCRQLLLLDIGNNEIQDTFPFWLESLPQLHVLVMRSNRFHGKVLPSLMTKHPFPKLQIFDISHNKFTGLLPTEYIQNFIAMMNGTEGRDWISAYREPLTLVLKGIEREIEGILITFTIIDLSDNEFHGSIPYSLGNLYSLKYLNLSHNNLTRPIPKSLGNLTALEALDLSSNQLVGKIPRELINLTFLAKLNLSWNHLAGPIPLGNQFSTFENDSYLGNSGLYGCPLTKKCKIYKAESVLPNSPRTAIMTLNFSMDVLGKLSSWAMALDS